MRPLTREECRAVDRIAVERLGVPGIVLMENAARHASDIAAGMLSGGGVVALCGGGNNGGDGLAVARLLRVRGVDARIALAVPPARLSGDALTNYRIARALGLRIDDASTGALSLEGAGLIVDALLGTGLSAAPRPPLDRLIAAVNGSGLPVLALDVPSGLDCDRGDAPGACVRAARTVTFHAPKAGYAAPSARPFLGELTVVDIGIPWLDPA